MTREQARRFARENPILMRSSGNIRAREARQVLGLPDPDRRRTFERAAWYRLDCPPQDNPLTDIAVKALADEMERGAKPPERYGPDQDGTFPSRAIPGFTDQ